MKIVLMGLEFFINNLGCEALSYSFVNELYSIVAASGQKLELSTIVFADRKVPYIPGTDIPIRCIGIHYKSPSFWKSIKREFRSSDYIFDFTMGDSFSDIYGMKRFVMDALVKTAAVHSGTPYILGPQTYGPYRNILAKDWAKHILKKADTIFTRDEQSKRVVEELTGREVLLTTDVAFALPYEKLEIGTQGKIKVGLNPSGLLWSGGYTRNNQFGLTVDYQKYCWDICERLSQNPRYEVYLISHVGTTSEFEDDYESDGSVCKLIQKKYPAMKVLNEISTPMDAKGYIAAMDVFIGARMHATIGAFSSGVATIPVSYSRKFEGLYESLMYDYLVHALKDTTEEAVNKTMEYIEKYQQLRDSVEKSMSLVKDKQGFFRRRLAESIGLNSVLGNREV